MSDQQPGQNISRLRKPNDSIHLRVNRSRLTVNGIRIFNVIIALVQNETMRGTRLIPCKDKTLEGHYWMSMPDFQAALNMDRRNKPYLINSLKQLHSVEVSGLSDDQWVYSNLLIGHSIVERSAVHDWAKGSSWVGFFLHPKVIDHIKDPMTRYTPIELMYQNRLSTVSAIILYEHCLSFLKLGRTMNHQVDNLIMFLRAQESSKDQRKISYREFKNDYLKKAIAEINTQTNVTIKVKEKRKSRRIDEVYFEVLPRIDEVIQEPVRSIDQALEAKELQARLNEIGFSAKESNLILATHRTERVRLALDEFGMILKKGKKFTTSAKAYFRALISRFDEEQTLAKKMSAGQLDWISEDRISSFERAQFEKERKDEDRQIAVADSCSNEELELCWRELLETMDDRQRLMFAEKHPMDFPKSKAMVGRYILKKREIQSLSDQC